MLLIQVQKLKMDVETEMLGSLPLPILDPTIITTLLQTRRRAAPPEQHVEHAGCGHGPGHCWAILRSFGHVQAVLRRQIPGASRRDAGALIMILPGVLDVGA